MKDDLKGVQNKCAIHAEISLGFHEEEHKLKEGKKANQLIKNHMLDVAEKVRAYFAERDATYADLIKNTMPVNEAHDESLKDFFENEAMDLQFL
jgi:hypothetical protein